MSAEDEDGDDNAFLISIAPRRLMLSRRVDVNFAHASAFSLGIATGPSSSPHYESWALFLQMLNALERLSALLLRFGLKCICLISPYLPDRTIRVWIDVNLGDDRGDVEKHIFHLNLAFLARHLLLALVENLSTYFLLVGVLEGFD